MLIIRLGRIGKKKQPEFRLVVQEKKRDPFGVVIEVVGYYNPRTNPAKINLKSERIQYWISKGAQTTPVVHNMLINAGIIKAEKKKIVRHHKVEKKEEAPKAEAPKAEAPKA